MSTQKVLYISQEIAPYLPDSTMSVIGRELPRHIQEHGFEARTFMPKYGCINERRNQLHEVIRLSGMNIIIDDTDHPLIIKVATLQSARMQVYFIDSDDYFLAQTSAALEIHSDPHENDERIIFFARGVIETVKKLRWDPVIIHCSGWISSLAPLYLKKIYHEDPSFRSTRVVYSLFDNDVLPEPLDSRFAEKLKLDGVTNTVLTDVDSTMRIDTDTLKKIAIQYSDGVVAATGNVEPELLEFARSIGKPVLDYPGQDKAEAAYAEFYRSLL